MSTDEKPLLTIPETADYLGIGKTLAWQLVARGVLPSVRLGRLVRVPRTRLEAWLAAEASTALVAKHRVLRRDTAR